MYLHNTTPFLVEYSLHNNPKNQINFMRCLVTAARHFPTLKLHVSCIFHASHTFILNHEPVIGSQKKCYQERSIRPPSR